MSRNHENRVTLIGKLGDAPEIKPTANGQLLILNLGVQVVSFGSDDTGQNRSTERTSWHRVVSFNRRVIRQARRLEKDDIVTVGGYLDQRSYEKDGRQLFITEFVAEELDTRRAKPLPLAATDLPPPNLSTAKSVDMLRITVELLPGGRETGARVISRGTLPITDMASLARTIGSIGD